MADQVGPRQRWRTSVGEIKLPQNTDCIIVDSDVSSDKMPFQCFTVFYTKRERSAILYQVSCGELAFRRDVFVFACRLLEIFL